MGYSQTFSYTGIYMFFCTLVFTLLIFPVLSKLQSHLYLPESNLDALNLHIQYFCVIDFMVNSLSFNLFLSLCLKRYFIDKIQ